MTDASGYARVDDSEKIIRLVDLKEAIKEKKRLREEAIIQDWMTCITREYIKEMIIQAESVGRTWTTIITYNMDKDRCIAPYELYRRYCIEDKIRVFLEPSMTVSTEYTSCTAGLIFRVHVSWGSWCTIL